MLYVKQSSSSIPIVSKYQIQLVSFKLGPEPNIEYEIPLPSGMYFWNTMLIAFTVIYQGNARDGINGKFVETSHSGAYVIKNSGICNQDAFTLVVKYR